MLFGLLLPWVVNIIDMSRVFGFIHVDSVAIAFGVTGLAFLPAMFRYRSAGPDAGGLGGGGAGDG